MDIATFQLAGFPRVISTMWKAFSVTGTSISVKFYEALENFLHDSEISDDPIAISFHGAQLAAALTNCRIGVQNHIAVQEFSGCF
jgi:hypothetical protein